MQTIASPPSFDWLVDAYQEPLLDVAGFQPSTVQKWTFFVRLLLQAQFKPKTSRAQLGQLTPEALLNFVWQQGTGATGAGG
jgi:hypothetical protein